MRDIHWRASAKRPDDEFLVAEYGGRTIHERVRIVGESEAGDADAMASAIASLLTRFDAMGQTVTVVVADGESTSRPGIARSASAVGADQRRGGGNGGARSSRRARSRSGGRRDGHGGRPTTRYRARFGFGSRGASGIDRTGRNGDGRMSVANRRARIADGASALAGRLPLLRAIALGGVVVVLGSFLSVLHRISVITGDPTPLYYAVFGSVVVATIAARVIRPRTATVLAVAAGTVGTYLYIGSLPGAAASSCSPNRSSTTSRRCSRGCRCSGSSTPMCGRWRSPPARSF